MLHSLNWPFALHDGGRNQGPGGQGSGKAPQQGPEGERGGKGGGTNTHTSIL